MAIKSIAFSVAAVGVIVGVSLLIQPPKPQAIDLVIPTSPVPVQATPTSEVLGIASVSATVTPAPIPTITAPPGDFVSVNLDLLCMKSYLASHNQISQKLADQVFAAYNIPKENQGNYRIDQFFPAELGGTTNLKNLWPQTLKDYKAKNTLETTLYAEVCSGNLSDSAARAKVLKQWGR